VDHPCWDAAHCHVTLALITQGTFFAARLRPVQCRNKHCESSWVSGRHNENENIATD
jgi:hypothetical protein